MIKKDNYNVYIPFVNNKPFLIEAIRSLGKYKEFITVIDNSKNQDLQFLFYPDGDENDLAEIKIIKPSVPLYFGQMFNLVNKISEDDIWIFMHSDGEASEKDYETMRDKINELIDNDEKWSVIFSNYDVFSAVNKLAFNDIGGCDTEFLRYFSDNDYFKRLELKDYKRFQIENSVKHKGSSTIKSDPVLGLINEITFPMQKQYYIRKWGGEPGQEVYNKPFNL